MSETDFFDVPVSSIRSGLKTAMHAFCKSGGISEAVAAQSNEMTRAGRPGAMLLQAGKFIIDATLAAMDAAITPNQPLPDEVYARRLAATYTVDEVAQTAAGDGSLNKLFGGFPMLEGCSPAQRIYFMQRIAFDLATIGSAPIQEVSVVAGGAVRMLQRAGVDGSVEGIVSRSHGLLDSAKLHKDLAAKVFSVLGTPYFSDECYRILDHRDGGIKVDFSEEVKAVFEANKGRGCPAGGVRLGDGHPSTLLHMYWERINAFLFQPGHTTDLPITTLPHTI